MNWPPKDKRELLAWQEAHGSDKGIARVIKRSPRTVYRYRKQFGVKPREERQDFSCGLSWPPNSSKEMHEWMLFGGSDENIALYIGQTKENVAKWRRQMGFDVRQHIEHYLWQMDEKERVRIYAGRRYEDHNTKRPEGN